MKFSTKTCIVAALAAAFTFAGPSAFATVHTDPCPGQHVQVYVEGQYNANSHFVCGTPGTQGKDGTDGKDGATGSAGPAGPKGDTGPAGADGAAGTPGTPGLPGTPGPAGPSGADGDDGDTGPAGGIGLTGPKGEDSTVEGPKGADGFSPQVDQVLPGEFCANGGVSVTDSKENTYYICAGLNGKDSTVVGPIGPQGKQGEKGEATSSTGARGVAGKDGKDGVTKTVYITRTIAADGTVTEIPVDSLPHTGADNWAMLLVALGLIGVGTAAVYYYRKN